MKSNPINKREATSMTKEEKYDLIVKIWTEYFVDSGDIDYLRSGYSVIGEVDDIIRDE